MDRHVLYCGMPKQLMISKIISKQQHIVCSLFDTVDNYFSHESRMLTLLDDNEYT